MATGEENNTNDSNYQSKEVKDEEKTSTEDQNESPVTHRIRNNPWILSTIVLGILAIILLAGVFDSQESREQEVTIQNVGDKVQAFYENYGVEGTSISNVRVSEKDDYFYRVELMYKGQTLPFYVTKTGYMAGNYLVSIEPNEDGEYDLQGAEAITRGEAASASESVQETNETQETSANLP